MKKKKTKLTLNKDNISSLQGQDIRGGNLAGRPCSTTVRQSYFICKSHEYNCHSNNAICDCGTTGNC